MAKDSSTIVVSGGSASVQTAFTTPLYPRGERTIHSQIFERIISH